MKVIPLPEDRAKRQEKANALRLAVKAYNAALLAFAVAAVACLVGVLVTVIMLETGGSERNVLLYTLAGCFAGGSILFALGSVLLGRRSNEATLTQRDFEERMHGEACFYVGEGTLAEFAKDALLIRPASDSGKSIRIPYGEVVFHSVCSRTKPQEKGKWSVVLEMPAHYVMKRGDSPKALVETDGKERLYRVLEERGLSLCGEQPPRGKKRKNVRFTPAAKFLLPDGDRRRRSLLYAALGILLTVGGACMAVFWRDMTLVGAILGVFGIFIAVRSLIAFSRAKGMLAFFEEGIYWQESGRPESDRFFLKWEQLVCVKWETVNEKRYLAAHCAYGAYHIPDVAGASEYLKETRPALWQE